MAAVEELVLKVSTDVGDLVSTMDQLEDLQKLIEGLKAGPKSPMAKPLKDVMVEALDEYFEGSAPTTRPVPTGVFGGEKLEKLVDNLNAVSVKLAQSVGISSTMIGYAAQKIGRKGYSLQDVGEMMSDTAADSEMVLSKFQEIDPGVSEEFFRNAVAAAAMDLPRAAAAGIETTVLRDIGSYILKFKDDIPSLLQSGPFIRLLWERWQEMIAGPGKREERKEAVFVDTLKQMGISTRRQLTHRHLGSAKEQVMTREEAIDSLQKSDEEPDPVGVLEGYRDELGADDDLRKEIEQVISEIEDVDDTDEQEKILKRALDKIKANQKPRLREILSKALEETALGVMSDEYKDLLEEVLKQMKFHKGVRSMPVFGKGLLEWLKTSRKGTFETGEGGVHMPLEWMSDPANLKHLKDEKFLKWYRRFLRVMGFSGEARYDVGWQPFKISNLQKAGYKGEDDAEGIMDYILEETGYEHRAGVDPHELLEKTDEGEWGMTVTEMKVRLTQQGVAQEIEKRMKAGIRKLLIPAQYIDPDVKKEVEDLMAKHEGLMVSVIKGMEQMPEWLPDVYLNFLKQPGVEIGEAASGDLLQRILQNIPGAERWQEVLPHITREVRQGKLDEDDVRRLLDKLASNLDENNENLKDVLKEFFEDLTEAGEDIEGEEDGE